MEDWEGAIAIKGVYLILLVLAKYTEAYYESDLVKIKLVRRFLFSLLDEFHFAT